MKPKLLRSKFLFEGIIIVSLILSLESCSKRKANVIGEVEAVEIDVGVKIPGRISEILIKEGDSVTKNQVLGRLESKEIDAKLQAATAAHEEAKKQYEFAKQSFERIKNLYKKGVAPQQQYDETEYKYFAAQQKQEATLGLLNEVKAYYEELEIKAPIDGEIIEIIAHEGEIVSSGYPIITILNPKNSWVAFYLREDLLKGLSVNDDVIVSFPALGKSNFQFKINYISSLGAFAKWKSTNEQGSFDLKTFEIRASSDEVVDNVRPGMTALVKIPYKKI